MEIGRGPLGIALPDSRLLRAWVYQLRTTFRSRDTRINAYSLNPDTKADSKIWSYKLPKMLTVPSLYYWSTTLCLHHRTPTPHTLLLRLHSFLLRISHFLDTQVFVVMGER